MKISHIDTIMYPSRNNWNSLFIFSTCGNTFCTILHTFGRRQLASSPLSIAGRSLSELPVRRTVSSLTPVRTLADLSYLGDVPRFSKYLSIPSVMPLRSQRPKPPPPRVRDSEKSCVHCQYLDALAVLTASDARRRNCGTHIANRKSGIAAEVLIETQVSVIRSAKVPSRVLPESPRTVSSPS